MQSLSSTGGFALLVYQVRHQSGPSGLMGSADATAVVTMEVFVTGRNGTPRANSPR